MKVEYTQTAPKSGCFGDCTAFYDVTIDVPCTVGEFINWVITEKSGEWGAIGISFNKDDYPGWCKVKCEYKWGKLLTQLPEKYLGKQIHSIKGHGGWTQMDYAIKIK